MEVNRAAVRGSAGREYPAAVIKVWAALSITDKLVEALLLNPDSEDRGLSVSSA